MTSRRSKKGHKKPVSLEEIKIQQSCINVPPSDERQDARIKFLKWIQKDRRHVLVDLYDYAGAAHRDLFRTSLPANREFYSKFDDDKEFEPTNIHRFYNQAFLHWEIFESLTSYCIDTEESLFSERTCRKINQLKSALIAWSERYNLTSQWCLEYALYTLFKWSILAPSRIDIDWLYTTQDPYSGIAASAPVEPREPFSFLFHAYRPEQDIWQSYEKGLRDSFEKYVQIYKEHMLSQSSQEQRLTACKNKVPDHFRWLVWYQIPQSDEDKSVLECGEIANKIGRDSSTVSEAIKQSASIIDLKLRPSRMGRPPLDLDLP